MIVGMQILSEIFVNKYSDVFEHHVIKLIRTSSQALLLLMMRIPFSIFYSLTEKVKAGIEELQKQRILVPVQYAEWTTPTVAIPKNTHLCRFQKQQKTK